MMFGFCMPNTENWQRIYKEIMENLARKTIKVKEKEVDYRNGCYDWKTEEE